MNTNHAPKLIITRHPDPECTAKYIDVAGDLAPVGALATTYVDADGSNARRLVASWNALRCMPIEQIEAMAERVPA